MASNGFIRAYGLHWLRGEVEWGAGSASLAGRIGERRPKLRVANFWTQTGIYVLHDDYGPYYVGLVRDQHLGVRLAQHTKDTHRDSWDRFSWFGFNRVLTTQDSLGYLRLGKRPQTLLTDNMKTIGDVEALLIMSLGTQRTGNKKQMKFQSAERWEQLWDAEIEQNLDKHRD